MNDNPREIRENGPKMQWWEDMDRRITHVKLELPIYPLIDARFDLPDWKKNMVSYFLQSKKIHEQLRGIAILLEEHYRQTQTDTDKPECNCGGPPHRIACPVGFDRYFELSF